MKNSGVEADSDSLSVMMRKLKEGGKSIPELMAEGRGQMASVSAAPAGGAGGAPAADAGGDAKADEKKEDKKEEEEDEDIDMGGMFGDDDDY